MERTSSLVLISGALFFSGGSQNRYRSPLPVYESSRSCRCFWQSVAMCSLSVASSRATNLHFTRANGHGWLWDDIPNGHCS
uniref:Putative secreted protein n=1 Tax=Anopheles darlingi TaxID=43151 RepID=A0A2M4DFY9_ANODA